MAGMFGGGKPDWGSALSAALAGWSAGGGNPAGQMALQQMHAQRMMKQREALEEQNYQRQRTDGMQDWIAKQQWELEHPAPHVNDTELDYQFREKKLGTKAADDWLRNPPQYMNVPGVGLVQIPSMGHAQQGGGPVGKLTPIEEGGPSQPGSGGFSFPF